MSENASDATHHRPAPRWPRVVGGAAVVLMFGALTVLFVQVEVSGSDADVTRACGSAFDAAIDRSGWETWWAQDLDETDPVVREALLRTTECPDAVNGRIVAASLLGLVGLGLAVGAVAYGRPQRPTEPGTDVAVRRLGRLATVTVWIGSVLTIAGVVAVVVLVADADSTLFLYTDRVVVAMAGLIVLVPAVALAIGGWALRIFSRHLAESDDGHE